MPADEEGRVDPILKSISVDPRNLRAVSQRSERRVLGAGVGIALLMHMALFHVLTRRDPDDGRAGASGLELDAISVEVELVPARALLSRADTTDPALGIAAPLATSEGSSEERRTQPEPEETRDDREKEMVARQDDAPVLEKQPREKATEDRERLVEARKQAIYNEPLPANVGGAIVHFDSSHREAVKGAAAASAGAIHAYANQVMDALNKSKPKKVGARGAVRLTFALLADGKLDFVRILKSSGNERLDQMALGAIRQASFPPPPRGMSALQRTFVLPYQFR
jgi:protein TonB